MVQTAFGSAAVVEEVALKQTADAKEFETRVQLLETEQGETLVRFAYSTDGVARRGPVTLRAADLRRLSKMLAKTPRLRAALSEASRGA